MNISEINFSKVVFPLEKELLDVCDGDIENKPIYLKVLKIIKIKYYLYKPK